MIRLKRTPLFASPKQYKELDNLLSEMLVYEIINDNDLCWEKPKQEQFKIALEGFFPDRFEEVCEEGAQGRHKSVLLVVITMEYSIEIDKDILETAKNNANYLQEPFQKARFKTRLERYKPPKLVKEMLQGRGKTRYGKRIKQNNGLQNLGWRVRWMRWLVLLLRILESLTKL